MVVRRLLQFLIEHNIIRTAIDLFLVILIITQLFKLMRGTKGVFFLNGIIILFLTYIFSRALGLEYLNLLLSWIIIMLGVALPVIFQNELKRAMEILGRKNPIIKWFVKPPVIAIESIDIVAEAVESLAKQKIGALIVLEREDPLPVVSESGSYIVAALSAILIEEIFYPGSPLHDGAILIKGNRIRAAGCFLPLDNQLPLPQELGSRHRAGFSLASQSDALVVIVSEETGGISLAYNGVLDTGYSSERLKGTLKELIQPMQDKPATTVSGKAEVK